MKEPITIGEKVDRDGPSALFVAIAELAEAHGRIPIGEWDSGPFQTDPRYRVLVNGGPNARWRDIPRFHALLEFNGWPAGLLNPGGGTIAINEDEAIAVVEREAAHHARS
jgi:hypothetical protein